MRHCMKHWAYISYDPWHDGRHDDIYLIFTIDVLKYLEKQAAKLK